VFKIHHQHALLGDVALGSFFSDKIDSFFIAEKGMMSCKKRKRGIKNENR
jgi:hypothetical protein